MKDLLLSENRGQYKLSKFLGLYKCVDVDVTVKQHHTVQPLAQRVLNANNMGWTLILLLLLNKEVFLFIEFAK